MHNEKQNAPRTQRQEGQVQWTSALFLYVWCPCFSCALSFIMNRYHLAQFSTPPNMMNVSHSVAFSVELIENILTAITDLEMVSLPL